MNYLICATKELLEEKSEQIKEIKRLMYENNVTYIETQAMNLPELATRESIFNTVVEHNSLGDTYFDGGVVFRQDAYLGTEPIVNVHIHEGWKGKVKLKHDDIRRLINDYSISR